VKYVYGDVAYRFSVIGQFISASRSQGLDLVQQCSLYTEFNSATLG